VDTRPPVISLKQIDDTRPSHATVEWDVRDENLDLSRFLIEYRVPGKSDWARYDRVQPGTSGTVSWNLDRGVQMEVRLRAFDRAGNSDEARLPVSLGAAGQTGGHSGVGGGSVMSGIEYVNSRTIFIKCNVVVGISGQRDFDLWYTRDGGRTWQKAPKREGGADPNTLPPRPSDVVPTPTPYRLIFEADADGLYGFTIVIRNGVGVGDPDPRPGDSPRFSVEVDTVKPKFDLTVKTGVGPDMRNVTIIWRAEDKNLTDRPVELQYAEIKNGQPPADNDWKPLPNLAGKQDRASTHVWTIGREGPFKFLVRATATDKANNSTVETIKEPIIIDLEHPRVEVIGIETSSPKP